MHYFEKKKLGGIWQTLHHPWFIVISAKTWRTMLFGLSYMITLLKTSASCLISPREVLPGGSTTIMSMDLLYPHPIQCKATLIYSMVTWCMTCIYYCKRHLRCISAKFKTGSHCHMRSISPRLHSMRTSTMLGYLPNFFVGQWESTMKTFGWSENKTSMHTSLLHRWYLLIKQARTIKQSTGTIDVL